MRQKELRNYALERGSFCRGMTDGPLMGLCSPYSGQMNYSSSLGCVSVYGYGEVGAVFIAQLAPTLGPGRANKEGPRAWWSNL